MKNFVKCFLIGIFLTWNTPFSFAQDTTVAQEIITLSKNKWQWMADKNMNVLDSLFHEKSVYVHMSGSWDKDREMEVIESGSIWYKKADVHDVSVSIVNNTAVVLSRIDLLAVVRGNEVTNPFVVTEVYIKEGTKWKLLSLSFTKTLSPN